MEYLGSLRLLRVVDLGLVASALFDFSIDWQGVCHSFVRDLIALSLQFLSSRSPVDVFRSAQAFSLQLQLLRPYLQSVRTVVVGSCCVCYY